VGRIPKPRVRKAAKSGQRPSTSPAAVTACDGLGWIRLFDRVLHLAVMRLGALLLRDGRRPSSATVMALAAQLAALAIAVTQPRCIDGPGLISIGRRGTAFFRLGPGSCRPGPPPCA